MSRTLAMIGRTLAQYRIVEEISRGGMGVVYRATDTRLGRDVALKVLPDDLLHDAERRERLLQEARAASALEHPHIAVIHAVDDVDGVTFIAMELIRGEKLSDTLARGPLSQSRALDLACEIAEGLARAHDTGIVHRDLKPANVMVTDDGHAKIIDFGLAKLTEPAASNASTTTVHGTQAGVILGTAAYMSPEQARGARIDHRSDVFSFGVLLYEMLTGRAAFGGPSRLDTLNAILTQPVPPLPATSGPVEVAQDLQRVIAKCTAKEPAERYQGMKDLVVDLRAARRRLESASGSMTAAVAPAVVRDVRAPGRAAVLASAALAVVAIAVAWLFWQGRERGGAAGPSGKPAVAVLYFENNTGDASLDWMRTGLADMLVTDLSQATDFEVLGTDRVHQILQELRRVDDAVMSADIVKAVADRAAVDTVVLGSYVKSGDVIRINARLQNAATGRVVTSERVEGPGETSLFSLVDELTRRFKSRLASLGAAPAPIVAPPGAPADEVGLDRGVTEITTSSIEAYRHYAEGIHAHERGMAPLAAPLLEKAIEVDPRFGMAYVKLAVVSNNLGNFVKRDEYAKRAVDLVDRLTARERYYIEGFFYSLRAETYARSLEAYTQGLALHPEHQASRHNLALLLIQLERFPEAIEHSEELIRRRVSNPTTYENLADLYVMTDQAPRARALADEYVRRYPDNASGLRSAGSVQLVEGRFDEALASFRKAEALNPRDQTLRLGRRTVALLGHRWSEAEAVAKEMAAGPLFERFLGAITNVAVAAARGHGREALRHAERAAALPGIAPFNRAAARNRLSLQLLRNGRAAEALAELRLAADDARGRDQEFETLQLLAVAHAAVGQPAESAAALSTLEARARTLPSSREIRRLHWARGEIALLAGDAATAATELTKAAAMLPPHGPMLGPPTSHVPLWYSAAVASVRAGRDADALPLLEKIQSGHERVFDMDAYARSFYLLAQIHERRSDTARAREQYARFLDLWRDGDMERGWVADAQKRLATLGAR